MFGCKFHPTITKIIAKIKFTNLFINYNADP